MRVIYQHPNTVSGVSVDHWSIATSCFDGFVRLFNLTGQVLMAEKRGSQLNAVATRAGVVASDDDTSTLKTGVAITAGGQAVRQSDFGRDGILAIDKTGRYGTCTDQNCYDRTGGGSFRVVPIQFGYDKWAMGVELDLSGQLLIASLDGYLRAWKDFAVVKAQFLAANGLNGVDTSLDGSRIVVTHWGRETSGNALPGLVVLNGALEPLYFATESTVVHQARFLPDNTIVYGTADGRLCHWDGNSPIYTAPAPVPVSKPGKHRK